MANTPGLPPKVVQGAISANGSAVVAGCSRATTVGIQIANQVISAPSAPTVTVSTTGGSLVGTGITPPAAPTLGTTSGTSPGTAVFVVITYVDPVGETTASSQSTNTPTTLQQTTVTSPGASGDATGYNIYASGTTGGPYHLQNTSAPINIGTPYTVPGTLVTNSASPPTTNTTGQAYGIKVTLVNQYGETDPSSATTSSVAGSTNALVVTAPTPSEGSRATHWNVYATQAGGSTYTLQNTTPLPLNPGGAATYTIGGPPTSSGASPPAAPAFTGTITFQYSIDGANWSNLTMTPFPTGTGVTTATAAGVWTATVSGLVFFQAIATAWTSGTAVVTINPTEG